MKILIVDDDPKGLYMLEVMLKGHGHEVVAAENGRIALQLARVNPPELIISDILMPVMDGYKLCQEWKKDTKLKMIPFVFYTATYTDPKDEEYALSLGAERFIVKPVEPGEFTEIIDEVIQTYKAGKLAVPKEPTIDEATILKGHYERMARKLEDKMARLEIEIAQRKHVEEALKRLNMELDDKVKLATRELFREKEKLDVILQNTADGILVTDSKNRVMMANPAAEQLLGFSLKKALGKKLDMSIRDRSMQEKIYKTREEKRVRYEFEIETEDPITSEPRVLIGKTACLTSRPGQFIGVVTTLNDITKLREVDRMKTEFLSTAAHELRTPLTSIQGFSEILITREDLSKEERRRFLSYINKQALGLAMIINDLLDISRIESGRGFALDKVKYDAGDAIKDIIPYFQEISPKHKIEVVLPDKPVELFADKEKMEQVLKNILSNAVKYSPEGGVIRVKGEVVRSAEFGVGNSESETDPQSAIEISVADQGIGMTPEQVQKIFDKFYRADASDTAVEGTGLGMTIVKYIVEVHGGKVWVESEPGKGTTVRFTIPV